LGNSSADAIFRLQRLQVFFADFHGDAPHDVLQRENHSEAILFSDDNTFHPGKGSRPNPRPLPYGQQGMRLGSTQLKTGPQRVDCVVRQRGRLASGSADNCQGAGDIQHPHPLGPFNVDKDITGKERKFQSHPRSVTPFAFRPVEGKIKLDLPLAQVLRDALLVAGGRVDGKPI
jgi:hypothetical protein